jgi:hypothetical protein
MHGEIEATAFAAQHFTVHQQPMRQHPRKSPPLSNYFCESVWAFNERNLNRLCCEVVLRFVKYLPKAEQ